MLIWKHVLPTYIAINKTLCELYMQQSFKKVKFLTDFFCVLIISFKTLPQRTMPKRRGLFQPNWWCYLLVCLSHWICRWWLWERYGHHNFSSCPRPLPSSLFPSSSSPPPPLPLPLCISVECASWAHSELSPIIKISSTTQVHAHTPVRDSLYRRLSTVFSRSRSRSRCVQDVCALNVMTHSGCVMCAKFLNDGKHRRNSCLCLHNVSAHCGFLMYTKSLNNGNHHSEQFLPIFLPNVQTHSSCVMCLKSLSDDGHQSFSIILFPRWHHNEISWNVHRLAFIFTYLDSCINKHTFSDILPSVYLHWHLHISMCVCLVEGAVEVT